MESSQSMNLSVVEEVSTLVQQHEQNENDDDKIRAWVDLPSELLNLISSSLYDPDRISFSSIRDQIRFGLTCKGWQSAVVPCLLGRKFPLLMSLKPLNGYPFTFFNPITNKEIQVFEEDNEVHQPSANVHCYRFGWWLICRGFSLFFYNPFIPGGSIIELPYSGIPDHIQYIDSMSFTAPPTSSDCIVYVHDYHDPGNNEVVVIHRWCYGEDHWTSYRIDCQLSFGQSSGNPIFYRNAFYQLNQHGRLGISDPKKGNEQHIWKVLPRPKPPSSYTNKTKKKRKRKQQPKAQKDITIQSKPLKLRTRHYMAECDGKLVMVCVEFQDGHIVLSVHVFELDWSRMEWVTVQSLGDKAMFICRTGSLLIKTNGGGIENKIYFPAFVKTDMLKNGAAKKVGGFYCLENRKCNFPSERWNRVTNCAWIDNEFQL